MSIIFVSLLVSCLLTLGDSLTLVDSGSRLPSALNRHIAVYDGHDAIYVFGGYNNSINPQDKIIKYSLESGAVQVVGIMPKDLAGLSAFMDGEDVVYFGGLEIAYNTNVYRFSTRHRNSTLINTFSIETGHGVA